LASDWGTALAEIGQEFQRTKDDLEVDRFTLGTGTGSRRSGYWRTPGSKILIMGDPGYCLILDRIGPDVEVAAAFFGASQRPTGQRGLIMFWRKGAGPVG
jgi:hypothetical protein